MVRIYATDASSIQTIASYSALGVPGFNTVVSNYCTCANGAGTVSCSSHSNCGSYGIPNQYVKVTATATLPLLFKMTGLPRQLSGSIRGDCADRLDRNKLMKLAWRKRATSLRKALLAERGTSIIEMALILPVFTLMAFGFINFCLVMFGLCNTSFATRAALRYATLHSVTSYAPTTQLALNNIVAPYVFRYPSNTYSVSYSYPYGANAVGQPVLITFSINYSLKFPYYTYNGIAFNTTTAGVIVQ